MRAGAFDAINDHRASLLASVGIALEAPSRPSARRRRTACSARPTRRAPAGLVLVEARPWDREQRLTEEKAALGFYLSGHPFSVYERELAGFARTPLAKLASAGERVWIAGVVASARAQMTRRGRMMVVMLDDGTAQLEIRCSTSCSRSTATS